MVKSRKEMIHQMSNMAQSLTRRKSITLAGVKSSKPRVCERLNPKMKGTIIFEGPEVSEILWDAGFKEYVMNKFLTRLKV
jgi:hypothetical protein